MPLFPTRFFTLKQHYVALRDRLIKKKTSLSTTDYVRLDHDLVRLKGFITDKNRAEAVHLTHQLEKEPLLKKSFLRKFLEGAIGLLIAILLATLIRQSWFELYEIPTGSMRPTFREQDFLSVTKTAFGINIPLKVDHFLFEEKALNRGSAIIFTGENLDLPDVDTTFLGIFPYKKRYVKRLIAKGSDTLYFYGGTILGLDKEGEPLLQFINPSWMKGLEYIPFISFEGKISSDRQNELALSQMNIPFAKLDFSQGKVEGQFLKNGEWIPFSNSTKADFFSLYGMDNYGKSRLLDKKEAEKLGYTSIPEAPLYLEIFHHPSLIDPEISKRGEGFRLALDTKKAYLPLNQENIDRLFQNLYTARFVVEDGKATRYSVGSSPTTSQSPSLPGVPDGTYEFYFGKGYQVGFGAHLTELAKEHPLMEKSPSMLKKLYNLGIEWDLRFQPKNSRLFLPSRFVYFKEGDLWGMGGMVAKKEEPNLLAFVENQKKVEKKLGFYDRPPPVLQTEEGREFLSKQGLHVPEKEVLVLGDNHAMSGDSRIFGFVPFDNLQGAPSLIFWPPGPRWGTPNMPPYGLFPLSRIIVWTIALLAFGTWWLYHRRRVEKKFYEF